MVNGSEDSRGSTSEGSSSVVPPSLEVVNAGVLTRYLLPATCYLLPACIDLHPPHSELPTIQYSAHFDPPFPLRSSSLFLHVAHVFYLLVGSQKSVMTLRAAEITPLQVSGRCQRMQRLKNAIKISETGKNMYFTHWVGKIRLVKGPAGEAVGGALNGTDLLGVVEGKGNEGSRYCAFSKEKAQASFMSINRSSGERGRRLSSMPETSSRSPSRPQGHSRPGGLHLSP